MGCASPVPLAVTVTVRGSPLCPHLPVSQTSSSQGRWAPSRDSQCSFEALVVMFQKFRVPSKQQYPKVLPVPTPSPHAEVENFLLECSSIASLMKERQTNMGHQICLCPQLSSDEAACPIAPCLCLALLFGPLLGLDQQLQYGPLKWGSKVPITLSSLNTAGGSSSEMHSHWRGHSASREAQGSPEMGCGAHMASFALNSRTPGVHIHH